jgi:glycosyltransferase involved in cell wall biosynthesis
VGLQALAECSDILKGYTIAIYSAAAIVIKEARLLSEKTGIVTQIIPDNTSHDEILSLHAQTRISIGLSISDAISTSLLEAMVMGSFPIQSCTACADEWIEHGVSGMIVPAEEPEIIAMWIRKALSDDELVNRAAQINWQTALARLDDALLKQKAIDIYNSVEQQ